MRFPVVTVGKKRSALTFLRRFLVILFVASILIQGSVAQVLAAPGCPSGMSQLDCNAIYGTWTNWVPDNGSCTVGGFSGTGSGSLSSGSSVYILGDSITERSQSAYQAAFQAKGITANIDASSSRSLNGPGIDGNKLTGMQAISQDTTQIRQAAAIIVALGTNGGDTPQSIDQAITAIRANNSTAPIYWVDTIGVGGQNFTAAANEAANAAIYGEASKDGYLVISWFLAVDPTGNPQNPSSPESDSNHYIDNSDGLGVHPTAAGITALTTLVVNAVSGDSGASGGNGSTCCASSSNIPTGSTTQNESQIWNYLIGKGFTPAQAAGLMGNIQAESGFNPQRVQSTPTPSGDRPNVTVDGHTGYGLVQWTTRARQQGLADAAQAAGKPSGDLGVQLDYMMYELTGPYQSIGNQLRQASSVDDASALITRTYEAPADIAGQIPVRQKFSETILATFGGSTTTGILSSSGCAGGTGQQIGNVNAYFQSDSQWANHPYALSTIGVSGCGPTSLATVISTLKNDRSVTPATIADEMGSKYYVPGSGTAWSAFTAIPQNHGLKSQAVTGTAGLTQAMQAIKNGALVIVSMHAGLFTSEGHIMVLRGVTADGRIQVIDVGESTAHHPRTDTIYTTDQITNNSTNGGTYWIITK